jgi:Domain of unknown function (DUF4440)
MNTTHLSLALVLAICLVSIQAFGRAGTTAKQAKPPVKQAASAKSVAWISKADEETLASLEREAWEVVKKKDWKAYDTLLTPEFTWIDDDGIIIGRAESVKRFSDFDLSGYTMQEVKVTGFGPGVAFVTYKVMLQGRFQGKPIPAKPSYIGSGYVKRGGKWMNFLTQSTQSGRE